MGNKNKFRVWFVQCSVCVCIYGSWKSKRKRQILIISHIILLLLSHKQSSSSKTKFRLFLPRYFFYFYQQRKAEKKSLIITNYVLKKETQSLEICLNERRKEQTDDQINKNKKYCQKLVVNFKSSVSRMIIQR